MAGWHLAHSYQLVMILLCAVFLALVGTRRESNITKNLFAAGFLVMFQNVGYLMLMCAQDRHEIVMALRIEYMGAAYLVTFMMIFVLQYCGRQLHPHLLAVLLGFDTLVLLSVWGCGFTNIYYAKLEYVAEPIPHIYREPGMLYRMAATLIVVQMVYAIAVSFQTWCRTGAGRRRVCYGVMTFVLFYPLFSYLISMSGILLEGSYDSVPGAAALTVFIFAIVMLFGQMFDEQDIAYANLIRKLAEPVLLVDKEYHFVECNDRAKEIFPSLRAMKEGDLLKDPLLLATLQDTHASDLISDDYIMRPDVQQILEHGELRGYAVLFSDLTEERRQLDETRQLKLAAEIANNAKSDFLAQMSHEIRTPINAVLGMNEMILRESSEETIRKYAVDIKDSAKSLLSIINEILDLTKIESGKMELMPVDYTLVSMLHDLYHMMNIKAKEKHLQLHFDIQPDIPSGYFGDDIRLRQILVNLLSNAIKYTYAGSVVLSVRGGAKGEVAYLRFCVTDTGIGIHEEDIQKLFDKYTRLDAGHTRQIEGTGLGLNITSRLLHMMNSDLKIKSTYGKGSTFYFDLNLKITDEKPLGIFDINAAGVRTDTAWKGSYKAHGAHILVVDDNSVNRRVFMNLLRHTGMKIDEADGGSRALELIGSRHYDLIFLDHMMPEMDGIETLHRMREMDLTQSGNAQTPVIMLTANAVVGAAGFYLKEGFTDFLTKPIDLERLDHMICRYLDDALIEYTDEAGDGK